MHILLCWHYQLSHPIWKMAQRPEEIWANFLADRVWPTTPALVCSICLLGIFVNWNQSQNVCPKYSSSAHTTFHYPQLRDFFLSLCMHMYTLYLYVYAVNMCVHMRVEVRGHSWMSFFRSQPLLKKMVFTKLTCFSLFSFRVFAFLCVCHCTHVEVRGHLPKICSLLLPRGSQGGT